MVAESMFPTAVAGFADPGNFEYGHRFTPTANGTITGIKFWRYTGTTATTRTVHLWDVATQTQLLAATTTGESGTGWYTHNLSTPFKVFAGKTYAVSYNGVDKMPGLTPQPPATAPHLTSVVACYSYTGPGAYPADSSPGSYLFADVVFAPELPLAVVAAKTAPDTYRFDVTGVEAAQFTVDYGDGTAPVTVPTHASGTTTLSHTYMVAGHHDYTVRVTATKAAFASTLLQLANLGQVQTPQSMFPTPPYAGSDPADYNVGIEFTPTRTGQLTAIKFQKVNGSPGPRRLQLWDKANMVPGSQLLEWSTSNEAASGWQTIPLPAPYVLQAGKTYVASWQTVDRIPYVTPIPPVNSGIDMTFGRFCFHEAFLPPTQTLTAGYSGNVDVVFVPIAAATLAQLAAVPGYTTLASWPSTSEAATVAVSVDVGPATIWATVKAGDPIPTVQVDTYLTSGQNVIGWEIARDPPGDSTPIYVGAAWQQAVSFVDALAPLGVPVTYRLRITYADYTSTVVSSNTVMITGTVGCYLTDPNTGITLRVSLVTWPERERESRRAVLGVLNRADPVTLSDQHLTPAGDWTLYTATDADTRALVELLLASTFATLRAQPDSSIASVTVSVGNVTERRYSGRGGDQRRFIDVEVQEIEPLPATSLPLNATLGGLATIDGDTLGELSQFRDTLLQLSMVVTGVYEDELQNAPNV